VPVFIFNFLTVATPIFKGQFMAKETGVVKWFNDQKGFGFITRDAGGADVFVHHKAINATGRRTLQEGDRVEFTAVKGDKGLQAEDVTVI
jgi:CspA family cold shock protein